MVYKSFKNLIMKVLKYTFLTMLFGCVAASCNFLDKDPYQIPQSDYFNTAAEASSFLMSLSSPLGSPPRRAFRRKAPRGYPAERQRGVGDSEARRG